jgi:hypothetical protein
MAYNQKSLTCASRQSDEYTKGVARTRIHYAMIEIQICHEKLAFLDRINIMIYLVPYTLQNLP